MNSCAEDEAADTEYHQVGIDQIYRGERSLPYIVRDEKTVDHAVNRCENYHHYCRK